MRRAQLVRLRWRAELATRNSELDECMRLPDGVALYCSPVVGVPNIHADDDVIVVKSANVINLQQSSKRTQGDLPPEWESSTCSRQNSVIAF